MGRDVAAELEHDLGVRRERDRRRRAARRAGRRRRRGAGALDVNEASRCGPSGWPQTRKRSPSVSARPRATRTTPSGARRCARRDRRQPAWHETPIPAGTITTLRAREELDVHAERRPAGAAARAADRPARGDRGRPRRRLVARARPDRPRVHRRRRAGGRARQETPSSRQRPPAPATGSSKSGRKLSTAAAAPQHDRERAGGPAPRRRAAPR